MTEKEAQKQIPEEEKKFPIEDEEESSVTYTLYESLPKPENIQGNIATIKSCVGKKEDSAFWKLEFSLLNSLRSINKFSPLELATDMKDIAPFISKCIDSLRSNVSKNGLLLAQELDSQFVDAIVSFIPSLFLKLYSEKIFLSNEAKTALSRIANIHNILVCNAIAKYIDSKNPVASEYSSYLLMTAFNDAKFAESEFKQFHEIWWKIWDGPRTKSKKQAEKTLIDLSTKIGPKLNELIAALENKKIKEMMVSVLKSTEDAKKPKMNMKDFKKMMLAKEAKM